MLHNQIFFTERLLCDKVAIVEWREDAEKIVVYHFGEFNKNRYER